MATQLQLRRGTTSQIAAFTGANGEIAVDTDVKTIYVQDGATAGGFAMARADFSNISASASLTLGTLNATTLNVTTLDLTTLEVTTIKAKDGTAAGSIADSTGVVTIASAVLTTADINAGTFDGVVGGTTPAAGSFTTLSASTSITGTLATAAQANITSVGTLTALTVDDDVSVQGAAPTFQLYDTTVTDNLTKFEYDETFLIDVDKNNARGNSKLQVKIDGTSAFVIDDNRWVGIGNDSPARALSTKSTSVTVANFESTSASGGLVSFSDPNTTNDVTVRVGALADALVLQAGGSTAMTVDSSQRVLIGTDSGDAFNSDSLLRIGRAGDRAFLQFKTEANYDSGILFGNTTDDVHHQIIYDETNDTLSLKGQSTAHIKMEANGNVDIPGALLVGTDVAYDKFAVLRTSTTQTAGMTLINDQSGGYGSGITWESKRSDSGSLQTAGQISIQGENAWSSDGTASSAFYIALRSDNSLVIRFTVTNDGVISSPGTYANTTANSANMYVHTNGVIYRSTSSRRYKNTIEDAKHGLSDLLKLRSVTYKGNDNAAGDTVFGGLIAEEVHDAGLTEFVEYNDDNEPDALAYGNMVSLCVKAIQEQQTQIEALKSEVAALKGG